MATPTPIDLRDTTHDQPDVDAELLDLTAAAGFVVEWQIDEPQTTSVS